MKKFALGFSLFFGLALSAQQRPTPAVAPTPVVAEQKPTPVNNNIPFNPDHAITADHEITIKGLKVPYKTTTGMMPVWDTERQGAGRYILYIL